MTRRSRFRSWGIPFLAVAAATLWTLGSAPPSADSGGSSDESLVLFAGNGHPGPGGGAKGLFEEGRQTFRFDTFGDEAFWGGTLQLHEAIAGAAHGGVGPGVTPKTALAVGLKVDVDALARGDSRRHRGGQGRPRRSRAPRSRCCKPNAVVGVTGFFDVRRDSSASVGIQCALCHSTVDDSFAPGIGHRLDGWANRDLNVGAIVALAPDLSAGGERCSASTSRPCARCSRAGARASSTPSSSSTARRSGRTARRRRP